VPWFGRFLYVNINRASRGAMYVCRVQVVLMHGYKIIYVNLDLTH
jgi:hypothetical protein